MFPEEQAHLWSDIGEISGYHALQIAMLDAGSLARFLDEISNNRVVKQGLTPLNL
jgi:hypothetical protein